MSGVGGRGGWRRGRSACNSLGPSCIVTACWAEVNLA